MSMIMTMHLCDKVCKFRDRPFGCWNTRNDDFTSQLRTIPYIPQSHLSLTHSLSPSSIMTANPPLTPVGSALAGALGAVFSNA